MPSLHQDLIAQATHLANLDKNKPKQANLRRAISSAYYALFHFLITESLEVVAAGSDRRVKHQLRRAFAHKDMKGVCKEYAAATGNPPAQINKNLNKLFNAAVQPQIRNIAKVFCELQEARHAADYDLSDKFYRTHVKTLITRVSDAINVDWPALAANPAAKRNKDVFLTDLAFRGRWERN